MFPPTERELLSNRVPFQDRIDLPSTYYEARLQDALNIRAYTGGFSAERTAQLMRPVNVIDIPPNHGMDDFYTNKVDWSSSQNLVAISVTDWVYVMYPSTWRSSDGATTMGINCACVKWSPAATSLFCGSSQERSSILLDAETGALKGKVRASGHVAAWTSDNQLFTGGLRKMVTMCDIREPRPTISLAGHQGRICGLEVSPDGTLVASGSNDDTVRIWCLRTNRTIATSRCDAAVKAISWHPYHADTLAYGGGTADHSVHIINPFSGVHKSQHDVQGQVTGLHWTRAGNMVVTTGFGELGGTVRLFRARHNLLHLQHTVTHGERCVHLAIDPSETCAAVSVPACDAVALLQLPTKAAAARAAAPGAVSAAFTSHMHSVIR